MPMTILCVFSHDSLLLEELSTGCVLINSLKLSQDSLLSWELSIGYVLMSLLKLSSLILSISEWFSLKKLLRSLKSGSSRSVWSIVQIGRKFDGSKIVMFSGILLLVKIPSKPIIFEHCLECSQSALSFTIWYIFSLRWFCWRWAKFNHLHRDVCTWDACLLFFWS